MVTLDDENYSEDSVSCHKAMPCTAPEESRSYSKRPRLEIKAPRPDLTSTETVIKMLCDERNSRDEFVIYGEYVANKLRNINTLQARNTAQYHINNILYQAETGQFDILNSGTNRDTAKYTVSHVAEDSRRMPKGNQATGIGSKWENESVSSIAESVHSLDDNVRIESVRIKVED